MALSNIKRLTACVYKVKLSLWILLVQVRVSLQGGGTIDTRLNNRNLIQKSLLIARVRC
jgi:hypothetical protein